MHKKLQNKFQHIAMIFNKIASQSLYRYIFIPNLFKVPEWKRKLC